MEEEAKTLSIIIPGCNSLQQANNTNKQLESRPLAFNSPNLPSTSTQASIEGLVGNNSMFINSMAQSIALGVDNNNVTEYSSPNQNSFQVTNKSQHEAAHRIPYQFTMASGNSTGIRKCLSNPSTLQTKRKKNPGRCDDRFFIRDRRVAQAFNASTNQRSISVLRKLFPHCSCSFLESIYKKSGRDLLVTEEYLLTISAALERPTLFPSTMERETNFTMNNTLWEQNINTATKQRRNTFSSPYQLRDNMPRLQSSNVNLTGHSNVHSSENYGMGLTEDFTVPSLARQATEPGHLMGPNYFELGSTPYNNRCPPDITGVKMPALFNNEFAQGSSRSGVQRQHFGTLMSNRIPETAAKREPRQVKGGTVTDTHSELHNKEVERGVNNPDVPLAEDLNIYL